MTTLAEWEAAKQAHSQGPKAYDKWRTQRNAKRMAKMNSMLAGLGVATRQKRRPAGSPSGGQFTK